MAASSIAVSRPAPPPAPTPARLPPLKSTRLLDQLRERIRTLHYSLRTEEAYVRWCRTFIRFHGLRHPADLGGPEVEAFPTWLACERSVAASTHKQALSALLVSVLSGAGCAATVDGRARPASGPPSTSGGADERGAGRRLPRPGRRTFAIREIALRHRYAPERGVAPAGQVTWTSPIVRWLCVPARAARTDSSCCRKA
jgi:Phage integrase, N-terminal SAM-like domain